MLKLCRCFILFLFRTQLWEAILERVGRSEDIKNVFLAIPELGKIFHSKKGDWLFGLVRIFITCLVNKIKNDYL